MLVSWGYDISLISFIIIAIILLIQAKDIRFKMFGIGMILKSCYVIYIGGDFMVGRHFTDIFWVSICLLIVLSQNEKEGIFKVISLKKSLSIIGAFCILLTMQTKQFVQNTFMFPADGISCADEKDFYYSTLGLLPRTYQYIKNGVDSTNLTWGNDEVVESLDHGEKGNIFSWAPGVLVYKYNDKIYMNDNYGLGDALISKLPSIKTDSWRVGHTAREVPSGYRESLVTGTNMIEDPSLHRYYDILLFVTRGDLWSFDRIKAAVSMAFGRYDYLVNEYVGHEIVYNIWTENLDYIDGTSFSLDISGNNEVSEEFSIDDRYRITELTLRTFTWDNVYPDDAVIKIDILDGNEQLIARTKFTASESINNGLVEINLGEIIVYEGTYKLVISTSNVEMPLGVSANKDAKYGTYNYNGISVDGAGIQYTMKGKKVYE